MAFDFSSLPRLLYLRVFSNPTRSFPVSSFLLHPAGEPEDIRPRERTATEGGDGHGGVKERFWLGRRPREPDRDATTQKKADTDRAADRDHAQLALRQLAFKLGAF